MTKSTIEDRRSLGENEVERAGKVDVGSPERCHQAQHAKLLSDLLQA